VDDAELLSDMFTQLLDAMLLQEDFAIINQVVLKLKAMEQRTGAGSPIGTLLRTFVSKMGEEQRLSRVGDVLKFSRLKNPQDIVRYLSNISVDGISMLLDVLEVVELPENRVLLCDVLVPFARDFPDAFVEKLRNTDRPQMQRDMVYVLDRSNHPDKLRFFSSALKSRNLALRLEVMGIIARGRTGEARKMIAAMLNDENMQVRLQAARVLPEFDRERGFADLMKLVKEKEFEDRKPEEKEAFYAAIGATGMPGAVGYFTQLLHGKAGLFNRQKVLADKQLAIAGLAGTCTIQAAKLLQELVDDRSQPPEVTTAAKVHLGRVRKQLFGSAEKEG
jgi:HEAT repeat protein